MYDSIIFFDGVCGLCNRAINWIYARDSKRKFNFAPLQGETAAKLLPKRFSLDLNTLVYYEDGKIWTTSDAMIMILKRLGSIYFLLGVLLSIFPRKWRDFGYKFISDRRFRWSHKNDSCRIPNGDEKSIFLD